MIVFAPNVTASELRCNHDEGAAHDCAYVDTRNRLIPAAEKLASLQYQLPEPQHADYPRLRHLWDHEFFRQMDMLWAKR